MTTNGGLLYGAANFPATGDLAIVYCQMLAFYKALELGISPDSPCPGGEVNRVVQGVTIYPLPVDPST